MADSINLYLQEQETLKRYKELHPELVLPQKRFSYQEILQHIGINIDLGFLPQGYLNLFPQDFIVEEITKDGRICEIEPGNQKLEPSSDKEEKTLYADLVKVGFSTLEAQESLAQALNIEPKNIAFAGIKDKVAVTSQEISIRGVTQAQIENLHVPGMFLKNLHWGKSIIEKGSLKGNRFTITVRTPTTLGQGWLDNSLEKIKGGFNNFYYLQRFGTPRLLSHILGKLILRQEYQETVFTFMTDMGVQGVGLLSQLREQVKADFGDWEKVEKTLLKLPYTFRLELQLCQYLKNHPNDYAGALKNILEQTTLWVYAYASYLFNLHLSTLIIEKQKIPEKLPLLLHPDYKSIATYTGQMAADGIKDINPALKKIFGHLPFAEKNTCQTKMPAEIISAKIIKQGVVISFNLPPGAYATTFLTHLFSLCRGLPMPEWLIKNKIDGKEILNLGSIAQTETILGQYMFSNANETSD